MRTPAKIHSPSGVLHTYRDRQWLLAEAARANDNIANLREVALRIGAKDLRASVTTEVIVNAVIGAPNRQLSADLQANKRAAARRTEDRFHLTSLGWTHRSLSQLKHRSDVRSPGRIGEHGRLQVIGRQAVADRQTKQIDHVLDVRPDEMRAENTAAVFLDNRLIPVNRLCDATRRVPVWHPGGIHAQLRPLPAGHRLGEPDGGDRRQREGDARHPAIIGPETLAF